MICEIRGQGFLICVDLENSRHSPVFHRYRKMLPSFGG
jgi:hypothetical protein